METCVLWRNLFLVDGVGYELLLLLFSLWFLLVREDSANLCFTDGVDMRRCYFHYVSFGFWNQVLSRMCIVVYIKGKSWETKEYYDHYFANLRPPKDNLSLLETGTCQKHLNKFTCCTFKVWVCLPIFQPLGNIFGICNVIRQLEFNMKLWCLFFQSKRSYFKIYTLFQFLHAREDFGF